MTAALWSKKPAVVFKKLKIGWHVGRKMEKTRPRLIGFENNTIGHKQTNPYSTKMRQ